MRLPSPLPSMSLSVRRAAVVLAAAPSLLLAQAGAPRRTVPYTGTAPAAAAPRPDAPVVTSGTIRLNGQPLAYTATTGMLPIRNPQTDSIEGNMFFVYYAKDGTDHATRPITFVFNGGPGSATVWLHMGAFGPKVVKLKPDGAAPPAPYQYIDNQSTLLDQTDLVFLDPVGTGYSRPTTPANGPKFWGLDEDVRSVGEFIRLFLTRYERWTSPKFVAGESYGTTRAAHLSGWLVDNGITLNGTILISAVLNFELSRTARGNDIAYAMYFPSHAATAWYHKRLPPDLQKLPLETFMTEVEQFTTNEYVPYLMKGDGAVTPADRAAISQKVARYTGLPVMFVANNDNRLELSRVMPELLRDQRRVHGRLDSRFTVYNPDNGSENPPFDPSEATIRNSFTPVLNDYVRKVLGYKNDATYWILGGGIGRWNYPQNQYADVVPSLEKAFGKNPDMKLYVAMGWYDLATPYWAVQFTLDHMRVDPTARAGIQVGHFTAGHMMYIDEPNMVQLRKELRGFIDGAVPKR